MKQLNHKD